MRKTALFHEISMNELYYMRDQGMSNKEIAETCGCSASTINKYLPSKRKPRAKLNDKDYKDISELYKNGNSAREIAKAYECSECTVYRILSANGVTPNKKRKDTVEEQHFATTKIQEPIGKDIHDQVQNHSSMKVYQIGIYEGAKGIFKVNLTEHTVELPDFPKCIGKDELEVYIRDLMTVWREM